MIKRNNDKKRIKNSNFKKLMEEIEPFIEPKKYIRYSTAGRWTLTELLIEKEDKLNEDIF